MIAMLATAIWFSALFGPTPLTQLLIGLIP